MYNERGLSGRMYCKYRNKGEIAKIHCVIIHAKDDKLMYNNMAIRGISGKYYVKEYSINIGWVKLDFFHINC